MSELDTKIDTIAKQVADGIDYEPRNFVQRSTDKMYAERDRILEERLVCCGECRVIRGVVTSEPYGNSWRRDCPDHGSLGATSVIEAVNDNGAHVVRLTVEVENERQDT